ncbi:hypothetical protein L3081_24810 [Colwellia sp. MSW7]|uniref:Flagellar transcriptional regulator FlhC n=1 Tax=Colwellia maritima TaxID=2912588 RepID=A0ABS9X8C7_9GAMM|nr:hypothetical protein [Colwellia maritima]MCI2286047.1 hypothetical protein [Colwellia maritima]
MNVLPKVKYLNAAIELASYGAQKSVIACYYSNTATINPHFASDPRGPEYKHRDGNAWLRSSSPLAYTADRLYRLYTRMFSDNPSFCSRKFGILELHDFFTTYKMLYPRDIMSVNRIHYWVKDMRSEQVFVAPSCKCCNQPFVFHPYDIKKVCNLCVAIERESLSLKEKNNIKQKAVGG